MMNQKNRSKRTLRALGLALGAPALALAVGVVATSCGSSNGPGWIDPAGAGGGSGADMSNGAGSSGRGVSSGGSASGAAGSLGQGDGAACATGGDLQGCPCQAQNGQRACYSGPPTTRNIGVCREGTQTCMGTELLTWGPCMQQVVPPPCTAGANCEGPTYCTPPQDAAPEADTPVDSGIPPHCHIVQGYQGNGTFADGSLYCEGNILGMLFGDGGLLSGFFPHD